jgi:tryptophan halogenase
LLSNLPSNAISNPNRLSFTTGKRSEPWSKNCVAIGLSSGFLEPLESTSIYLIQAAIMKLLELFPQRGAAIDLMRSEFNRSMNHEMERVRDFLVLHYHATERSDSEFWNYMRTMDIPDSLAKRMALFSQTGQHLNYDTGLFLKPSWISVYLGQRRAASDVDPRVLTLDPEEMKQMLERLKDKVGRAASSMPAHKRALLRYRGTDAISQLSLYGVKRVS